MRLFIFTMLFPPLALAVYFVTDFLTARDFLSSPGLLLFLLGWTYLFTLIPAWVTAGIDWALSAKPVYLRIVATMPVAAVMGVLVAHYLGERDMDLTAGFMGALPAAACSWLSGIKLARAG